MNAGGIVPGIGLFELLIVVFVLLWQVGLPIAVTWLLILMWRRLQRIEQTLQALNVEWQQRK